VRTDQTCTPGRRRRALAAFATLLLAASPSGAAGPGDQSARWSGVERVVAFADVHGAYEELTALLRDTGSSTRKLRWAGGRTHLVSLGDLPRPRRRFAQGHGPA